MLCNIKMTKVLFHLVQYLIIKCISTVTGVHLLFRVYTLVSIPTSLVLLRDFLV